jgi:nucleoside-diphosphate-sugar epimerase
LTKPVFLGTQPGIHELSGPENLNTSLLAWYNNVVLGKSLETSATDGSCWIDVRDLAEAHVRAIQVDVAGGERIIVSDGTWEWCTHLVMSLSFHDVKAPLFGKTGVCGRRFSMTTTLILIFTGNVWILAVNAANTLAQSFPNLNLPRGYPEKAKNTVHLILYDTAKADRILKLKYRSMEETTRDTLNDFEERGWLDVVKK